MKYILFLVIYSTYNQLIVSTYDDDDGLTVNNNLTTLTSTIKPLTTTQSSIDSSTTSSSLSTINDVHQDDNVTISNDDDDDDGDNQLDEDENDLPNQLVETLDGQAQSQRPFIRGRGDQSNLPTPIPNYGLPFANLIPGLQNGLINNNQNGNNQRGQLPGPLDLLSRFLPTGRPNPVGPLTNSFAQPGTTGGAQGYPNYPGLGGQNLRPGGMNSRLPGGAGGFNRFGSPDNRFNGQRGGPMNNVGGRDRVPDEREDDDGQEDNRQEPERGEDEETDQGPVNSNEEADQGGKENESSDESGQNEAAPQDDGSSDEGQQADGQGEGEGGGGEDGNGEGSEEGGDGGGEEDGAGGDEGGAGGGDPANDPDLAQFERLSQGSNFPGDLFPPGLLSQQDLADIQKSMDEQAKKDAERQRQGGGDEQGDSSNSSPQYDDEGTAATDETPSYKQPNNRGAYRSSNIANQRKFNEFLNNQRQSNQQRNQLNYLTGDYGQNVQANQPSAYPSTPRKSGHNQGSQLDPINSFGDGYFADSNLHPNIGSNVHYSPDSVSNQHNKPQSISSSSRRLTNVPNQSPINFPIPSVNYDDDKHSTNPGNG